MKREKGTEPPEADHAAQAVAVGQGIGIGKRQVVHAGRRVTAKKPMLRGAP
jgi:hypothetical protein